MFSSNTTNALNLFPTTSGPSATQTKLARLLYDATANARGPTEIQTTLARSLFDDAVQYMNTLEMNRAASYTFGHRNSYGQNGTTSNELGGNTHGESIASEMWELAIDLILEKYTQHSVLALCKTISLVQHVLLHGSESIVTDGGLLYRLQMAVGPLRQLNTALVEQQMVEQILNKNDNGSGRIENDVVLTAEGIGQQLAQFGTRATATMVKLRGGSVDQGHPVRVAASNLFGMASNPTYLKQLRMQQAGANNNNNQFGASSSLVPIGSTKQVGYITDDARLQLLEQKMAQEEQELKRKQWEEQQKRKQTRSNLAGKSATDSFGGGYAANGGGSGIVVGAAHSLEDMIKTAKYELEQHKAQKRREVAFIKKGYCDDPSARARQLQELEGNNNNSNDVEMDPKFLEKEKALNDALEYLEEMQQVEREKVDNLLEEDFLGNGGGGSNSNAGNPSGDVFGGSNAGYGADLLGFDNNPSTSTAPPTMDVFGGASPSMPMASSMGGGGGGGSMDLLGFSGGPYAQQAVPSGPAPGGNIMGGAGNNIMSAPSSIPTPGGNVMGGAGNDIMSAPSSMNNNAAGMGGDFMGAGNGFDLRPSLVTGMSMGAMNSPGSGPAASQQPFRDAPVRSVQPSNPVVNEEAEAENSRKMQMAAGLFAGVNSNQMPATQGRKPIMQMNSTSSISALDDLIPALEAPAPPPMMSSMGNNSVFDGASNELNPSPPIPSSDPFELGGGGIMGIGGNSGGDNDFSSRDMGPPPPPPMAPPPPPMEPPPPLPPTMAPMPPAPSAMMAAMPTMAPSPGAMNNNNMMGGNQSVEQMQAMIQQQQAQMNQMMQMMQQMQMQGGSNNPNNGGGAGGGMGGWPPPS